MPEVTVVNPSDVFSSGETPDRAMLANALKSAAPIPSVPSAAKSAAVPSAKGGTPGGVREQQRSAQSSYPNVTTSGRGYTAAVTGQTGGVGKKPPLDSNGDGHISARERLAAVLRWIGAVFSAHETYAIFALSLFFFGGAYNALAWMDAAYKSNSPIHLALFLFVLLTGIEIKPVIESLTENASIALLVKASRTPDFLPELKAKMVPNATSLMHDFSSARKVMTEKQNLTVSFFLCGLETVFLGSATGLRSSGNIITQAFGLAILLFAVCSPLISMNILKYSLGRILTSAERALQAQIQATMDITKTIKL